MLELVQDKAEDKKESIVFDYDATDKFTAAMTEDMPFVESIQTYADGEGRADVISYKGIKIRVTIDENARTNSRTTAEQAVAKYKEDVEIEAYYIIKNRRALMKRGLCIILLACMFLTACAGKGANKTEPVPHKNIYSKDECTVNYESAISKCAGAPGTEYEAYRYVDDDLEHIHSEKEWVDKNGHLRIPFSVDDSLRGHTFSSFYIPDSLVRKASSEDLVEVYSEFTAFTGWGGSYFFFDASEQMTWLIRNSNILQELMRRDDFAEPFYNKYMTTEFPEYMDKDYESQEFIDKAGITIMLFTTKFILAQPEACDQLTQEQRVNLVKHLVKETELTRKKKIMPYYGGYDNLPMPDCNFFTWVVEGNSWYYAINDMALTAEEWKVIDSMVEWNEKK